MADGVNGPGSAPANQTTNAGQSATESAADDAAKSKFGETLEQENICPEGLSRRPPDGCTYLRKPSLPSQPANVKVQEDPNSKSPIVTRPNGPDYKKPIHQLDSNPLSDVKLPDWLPTHDGGLSNDGHILMKRLWGTPQLDFGKAPGGWRGPAGGRPVG